MAVGLYLYLYSGLKRAVAIIYIIMIDCSQKKNKRFTIIWALNTI